MRPLVWSSSFIRTLKRRTNRDPQLRSRVEQVLHQLAEDAFHPSLRSHKLKGNLSGVWACSVTYDLRIIFEFVQNPETEKEEIFLLAIGTHDEVY